MNLKDWAPIIAAVITGVLANIITNFFTNKRAMKEKRMQHHLDQLQKVYAPLIRFLNPRLSESTESLTDRFDAIEKIIQDNIEHVDTRLNVIVYDLREAIEWLDETDAGFGSRLNECTHVFIEHVYFRFEWLKKQLRLSYDKDVFWPRRAIKRRLALRKIKKIKKRYKQATS